MRIKTTPSKSRQSSRIPTPIKSTFGNAPGKISISSRQPAEPGYFRSPAVKRSVGKTPTFDEILTIEELLDVPMMLPSYKTSMIKSRVVSPIGSRNITPIRNPSLDKLQKMTISQLQDKFRMKDSDRTFPKKKASVVKKKVADFKDILDGVRQGILKWDQLVFNKSAFEYLKGNLHRMD